MKKRKLLLSCLASLIIITVSVFLVKMIVKLSGSSDDKNSKRDSVAIYIDESVGDGYVLSSSKTFPGAGYVLDTDKSECTNDAVVSSGEDRGVDLTYSKSGTCKLYFYRMIQEPLSSKILGKANASTVNTYTGKTREMYTFSHNATPLTGVLTDYRYIGNTPNNYVKFNNEVWRIIGLFSDNGELKVKLIRADSIGNIMWSDTNKNEWLGSSLFNLLNSGAYYTRTGTYASTGLTATAKNQISTSTWYLGGTNSYAGKAAEDYYYFERGTDTCASLGYCSSSRSTSVTAGVGLFYPSDYIFTFANGVDNTCFNTPRQCQSGTPTKSWMWNMMGYSTYFKWGITPFTTTDNAEDAVYVVDEYGNAAPATPLNISDSIVFPVVYLRGDLWVTDGDGSKGNPYVLDTPFYTVVNDSYSFPFDAVNQRFASNNQNQNSTTAMTVVHIASTIPEGIRVDWTVNSEANYDKFTFMHNAVVLENEISGAGMTGSYNFNGIMAGDTLTFKYAKDSSQSQNGDTATFKIVRNPTVQNDATYYFAYDSSTQVYTSNNQNIDNSTARTKITFHESKTVVVEWTVNSEASYDKFRILKNGVQFLADQSGAGKAGNTLIPVIPGDVLTFEYAKDHSQSTNGDTAGFMIS